MSEILVRICNIEGKCQSKHVKDEEDKSREKRDEMSQEKEARACGYHQAAGERRNKAPGHCYHVIMVCVRRSSSHQLRIDSTTKYAMASVAHFIPTSARKWPASPATFGQAAFEPHLVRVPARVDAPI